jgi:gamma-glutamyl-gamma-aminobutyrate hydrolase PuuD
VKVVLTVERGFGGGDYLASLRRAGFSRDEIVVLPPGDRPPERFDGLVLSGGGDVAPDLFGESPHVSLADVDRERDLQEISLIERARGANVPIFGICRGLQILNVAFGGTLVQDLPALRPSAVSHSIARPRDHRAHEVTVEPGSRIWAGSTATMAVNSRHHQAIGRLGEGLAVAARAPDGIVEAVESGEAAFAVQWHPENLASGPEGAGLFEKFSAAVRRMG